MAAFAGVWMGFMCNANEDLCVESAFVVGGTCGYENKNLTHCEYQGGVRGHWSVASRG